MLTCGISGKPGVCAIKPGEPSARTIAGSREIRVHMGRLYARHTQRNQVSIVWAHEF